MADTPPRAIHRRRFSQIAAALLGLGAGTRAFGDPGITTPEDLWRGYDPEALPLEIETIRSWEEGDLVFQSLRFTGEIAGSSKVRVFAIQGAPRDGKALPGVLHVHGGGQTASIEWVRFWARRGYVGVTFDFCGKLGKRTDTTDWGTIKQGNMAEAGGGFQLKPTPRESSWYHWALVSRRALTLLAKHPQADPGRLGVFGVSVGGTLSWLIAGSDPRVKAAAPIYGCGYNYDRRNAKWDILVASDDYNAYQRVLSPEAHAPLITCPILFLSATNDGHGLLDRAYDALGAVQGPAYQAISPRTDHHVEPREGRNLPLWMDWHLRGGTPFPKSPDLKLALDAQGVPSAIITPDLPDDVTSVTAYHALGDKRPSARFWRESGGHRQTNSWRAALPVMDTWDDLFCFANLTYRSGVCLSTPLRHAVPAQVGNAKATLAWQAAIEHGTDGVGHWKFLGGYTDPCDDWTHLETGKDDTIGPFLGFNAEHLGDPVLVQIYTHILGDPQFQGREGHSLAFQVRGAFTDDGLLLTVIEQERSLHARSYTATVPRADLTPGWRQVVLPLSKFTHADGRSPLRWQDLDRLEVRGHAARTDPPRLAKLRWLDPR